MNLFTHKPFSWYGMTVFPAITYLQRGFMEYSNWTTHFSGLSDAKLKKYKTLKYSNQIIYSLSTNLSRAGKSSKSTQGKTVLLTQNTWPLKSIGPGLQVIISWLSPN